MGEVWKGTVRRLMSRVERMKVAVRCRAAKEMGRGSSYKPIQENKMITPLGEFDEAGISSNTTMSFGGKSSTWGFENIQK